MDATRHARGEHEHVGDAPGADLALAARTATLGAERMDALRSALRTLEPAGSARLDLAGWLGS